MKYPSAFEQATTDQTINRLENLNNASQPLWGKMSAGQMLAHLNVAYDHSIGGKEVKTNWLNRFMIKTFVKKIVVSETPYQKNGRTAPYFLQTEEKDFEAEKTKFISNVKATQEKGAEWWDGKESSAMGPLTKKEWSNLFQKHIDHHFTQFGV